jgi:hypothetical protein
MPTQSFSSFEAFFDAFRFASMRAMVLGPAGENWVLSNIKPGQEFIGYAKPK